MKSWRTTVAGLAVMVAALWLFREGKSVEGGATLVAGLGLLAAKDHGGDAQG